MPKEQLQKTAITDKNGKATHVYTGNGGVVQPPAGFRAPAKPREKVEPQPSVTDRITAAADAPQSQDPAVVAARAKIAAAAARSRALSAIREYQYAPETEYRTEFGEGTIYRSVEYNEDGTAVFIEETYSDLDTDSTALSVSESVLTDDSGRLMVSETVVAVNQALLNDNEAYSNDDEHDEIIENIASHSELPASDFSGAVLFRNKWVSPNFDAGDVRQLAEKLGIEVADDEA